MGAVSPLDGEVNANHDLMVLSMPGVGLMVRVVGLGSEDPEFKSRSAVELIPDGVNSSCHPSEFGKMSASLLVSCVGVATHPAFFWIWPVDYKAIKIKQD